MHENDVKCVYEETNPLALTHFTNPYRKIPHIYQNKNEGMIQINMNAKKLLSDLKIKNLN